MFAKAYERVVRIGSLPYDRNSVDNRQAVEHTSTTTAFFAHGLILSLQRVMPEYQTLSRASFLPSLFISDAYYYEPNPDFTDP